MMYLGGHRTDGIIIKKRGRKMMKIKNFAVKAALLVESLLTLTACTDKNTEKNAKTETKITSVDLELDAEETTQKIYHAHFN